MSETNHRGSDNPLDEEPDTQLPTETPEKSELREAILEILREAGISEETPQVRLVLSKVESLVSYRGPIPPPEMLEEYERIHAGLAQLIIESWQDQAKHRRALEVQITSGAERRMDKSQTNALIVSLAGIIAASSVGILGNWYAAAIIAVVAVGGPSAATIIARYIKGPYD